MNRITGPVAVAVITGITGITVTSCGTSGPTRADAVAAFTDVAVPRRFAALAAAADELPAVVGAWCDGDASGDAVTAVTGTVRAGWLGLAPFWFGPVMERRSRFVVDNAIDPEGIDALAKGTQPVDAASLRDLAGADQRGVTALDHLAASPPDPRRCAYALGLAELVDRELDDLAADWAGYGPSLADDDAAANMTLADTVSEALFAVRTVKERPDAVGNDALVAGIRWMLLGDGTADAPGIAPLLGDDTVSQLTSELDAGSAGDYERTIATSVVAELGITVNFSDADGDG